MNLYSLRLMKLRSPAEDYWLTAAQSRLVPFEPSKVLAISDETVARAVREKIDSETYSLRTILSTLNTRRNALLLVCRLPSEVLAHIFKFIDDPTGPIHSLRHLRSPRRSLGWIRVTHVCRKWRQIGLENPFLWSNIITNMGKTWIQETLRRSKSSLITIRRATQRENISLENLPVSQHLSHLQYLYINAGQIPIHILAQTLKDPAPFLQVLELTCIEQYRTRAIALPLDIFANQLPRLHSLELVNLSFPWATTPLIALVHLKIFLPQRDSAPNPTDPVPPGVQPRPPLALADFLDALEHMTLLETMEILDGLPTPPSGNLHAPAVDHIIRLPRLTSIILKGLAIDCYNLVRCLQIPPTAHRSFQCCTIYPEADDCKLLIPFLAPRCGGSASSVATLKTLWAFVVEDFNAEDGFFQYSLDIKAWNSIQDDIPYYRWPSLPVPTIRFAISWHSQRSIRLGDMVGAVCKGIYTDDITILHVSPSSMNRHLSRWAQPFLNMRKVTDLQVSGDVASPFIEALCAAPAAGEESEEPRELFFPQLRWLRLGDIDFHNTLLKARPFHEALPDLLRIRQDSWAPLQRLFIERCQVNPEWIDRLKEVILDVVWDSDTMNEYWDIPDEGEAL